MDPVHIFSEYFFTRLLINTGTCILLVRIIYYSIHKTRDLFFPFFILNFTIFLLAFMIEKAKAFGTFGSAFGLLAAFSLLRFRAEALSPVNMTYLFLLMALGVINSIMTGTLLELVFINVLIASVVYIIDGNPLMRNQKSKFIDYDSTENIQPEHHAELIAELRKKTGLNIQKIAIDHIDYLKKKTTIKIYYY